MSKPYAGRLIFDHLPKTAGISIHDWLVNTLGSGVVTPTLIIGHRAAIRQYGGEFSVISGHIHFQDTMGLDPRYQYITCLREPIGRALSWLYFLKNNHERQYFPLKSEAELFIEREGEYNSSTILENLNNIYIRHFCSIDGLKYTSARGQIDQALQAISNYRHIGFFDRLPMFVSKTASLIGVSPPEQLSQLNSTRFKPAAENIPSALAERLVALNTEDIEFYRAAERAFCPAEPSTSESHIHSRFPSQPLIIRYDRPSPRIITTDFAKITSISIRERTTVRREERICFDLEVFLTEPVSELIIGMHIFDSRGDWAYGTNNKLLGIRFGSLERGPYLFTYDVVADLPVGNYQAGFSVMDEVNGELQTIAWYEIACSFQVVPDGLSTYVGYMPLRATIALSAKATNGAGNSVPSHNGSMRVLTPVAQMIAGRKVSFAVEIFNDSPIRWAGDEFRPINLSYHWMTLDGTSVEFDCLRTPLLHSGIDPGLRVSATITVQAPQTHGMHRLILTLVHENVCWFETTGFDPGRLELEILTA